MAAGDTQMIQGDSQHDSVTTMKSTNTYTDSRYHYVVTAHKPTAVKQSLLGNIKPSTKRQLDSSDITSITNGGSSSSAQQLIVARSNAIDIYTVHHTADAPPSLSLLFTFTIHATIADIALIPIRSSPQHHHLFILTETNLYSIIQLHPTSTTINNTYIVHTLVHGSLQQKLITPSTENGPFIIVDHSGRYIIVHSYSGILQILDLSLLYNDPTKAIRLCRIEEYHVESICQLSKDVNHNLCIAILYVDTRDQRFIKFYELKLESQKNIFLAKSLTGDGVASGIPVDATTTHILATSVGSGVNGLIAVSEEQIAYIPFNAVTSVTPQSPAVTRSTNTQSSTTSSSSAPSPSSSTSPNNPNNYTLSQYYKHFKVIDISPAEITCFTMIDSTRYLLGDLAGNLYVVMLQINTNNTSVIGVQYDILGAISIAQSLTYIGGGLVFIGSVYNDSQLIRLMSDIDETGTYISPLQSMTNIGPITDMTLTTIDNQSQLLTCSGAYRDGTIRIIKQGISIREEASLELEGTTIMYSLYNTTTQQSYLLLSFINESRILATSTDDALEEIHSDGFDLTQSTIYASEISTINVFLQITPTTVRIIDNSTLQLVHQYQPTTDGLISVAYHNESYVVIAVGKQLIVLNVTLQGIDVVNQLIVDNEIACVTINATSSVVAIGLWQSNTVQLLALPSLQLLHSEAVTVAAHADTHTAAQGDTLPRSILFASFSNHASADGVNIAASNTVYLFVGLGDGHLLSFQCQASTSTVQLSNRKLLQLGNQPLFLKLYQQQTSNTNNTSIHQPSQSHVFVSCDRPHVISSSHGKLLYTPVHLRDVITIANFYTPTFHHCIAFVTKTSLIIGRLDSIQKLHIKSIPLNEQIQRITYISSIDSYAIASINYGGQGMNSMNDVPELSLSPGIASVTNTPNSSSSSSSAIQRKDSTSINQPPSTFDSTASNTAKHLNTTLINDIVPELHHVRLYSRTNDYQPIADIKLNPNEYIGAITVLKLGLNPIVEYLIVGTGYNQIGENYITQGRLLLLDIQLNMICETTLKGQVYCLQTIHQDRLVVGINSRVEIYEIISRTTNNDEIIDTDLLGHNSDLMFQLQVSHKSHVDVVTLDVIGDYIILGDILQSMKLLRYKPLTMDEVSEGTTNGSYKKTALLEQVACDYDANSMVAVTALSTDTYVGSDGTFNLLAMRRNLDAMTDDDRHQLQVIGRYHLGDQINCFIRGSLVQRHDVNEVTTVETEKTNVSLNGKTEIATIDLSTVVPTHLFGTLSGMIGVIASLTRSQYQLLVSIEDAIRKIIPPIANFRHTDYRAFKNERRTTDSIGFIDGDLVESLLELPLDQQQQIAVTVGLNVQQLIEKLEDLTRIH